MTRIEACLILNMVEHVGPVTVRRLTQKLGTPEAILEANYSQLKSIEGVSAKSAKSISEWRQNVPWEKELEIVRGLGLQLIGQEDVLYPTYLQQIHDPPLVLYVQGNLRKSEKNALAIVGMRHPTHYGIETARSFGYQLGNIGMSIVSGLALGIDSAAHRGCLQAKGHTVAVLGFGFQYLAKAENTNLAKEIIENGGAVVSEFPYSHPPNRQTFPMRNRIVSGMTLGTLVVEAGVNSGALITAHFALEQGRQVFAVPGRVDSSQSHGCHKLIQTGAKLTQTLEDILEEFEHLIPRSHREESTPSSKPLSQLQLQLTETEEKIFNVVLKEETEIDTIIALCELPSSIVSATLIVLEMKHLVRQLPGKRYVRLIG